MGVLDRYKKDEKKKTSVLDRYKEQPRKKPSDLTMSLASSATNPIDVKKSLANLPKAPIREEPTKEQPVLRGKLDTDLAPTEKQQKQLDKELNKGLRQGFGTPYFGKLQTPMELISEGVMEAGNAIGLGIPDSLTGRTLANRADYEKTAAGTAGKVVGELAGFGKAYKLTKGIADAAIRKGAGRAVERELATQGIHSPKMAEEFIRGGIAEGAFGTAKELADVAFDTRQNGNEGIGTRIGNVATASAYGAVGDAGVTGLLGKLFNRTGNQEAVKATEEILALPAPRGRGNINTAQTPDVINGQGGFADPLGLPAPNIAEPTIARASANPYRVKYENLIKAAKQQTFTPGREIEELDEMWGRMAGREDPGLDELINLAYPKSKVQPGMVGKARENQRMREVSGVGTPVKSVLDRYRTETGTVDSPVTQIKINRPRKDITQEVDNISTSQPKTEAVDDIIKTKEPRVRDKIVSYLDEQEKAARERLKAKRNTLSSNPIDQYADYAIILAAKAGKGTIKLADAAEFLVKEFGEEIRPHVQSIVNRARGVAKEAERRASKEAQDARTFNNADSGDASTFRNKVSRNTKTNKVPFAQRWEKLRTQLVDDLAPLEGLEKRVRGKVSSAEDSLYKSGRLFRGVPEKANRIVKDKLAPIINRIEGKGYTSADLGDYALAVHAKNVNARDIKSGFTNKEIDEVINRLGTTELEAARKQIIKISDDMLTELEKQGVISGELVTALKERYPNYMPLFRNFDDESVNFSDGLSKALANVTSPIKGLKGSERQVIDPMESMVKNIFQSTNAAERNKVASQLAKLAKDDPDGNFIRELADGEEVGRKNVVTVLRGGEKVKYEVEPEVYKAMLNLDQESTNTLIKVFQKPASLLRAGATLTPEFSLRNPLRDVVQAFVTSNSGFNPLIDFPVGLIQSISKGNLYKKWVDELGSYGNIISNDRDVHKEALERVLKESPGKKFVNVINGKSLMRVLRAISDTTESATKVGEFRAALRKGESPQEAAYRSRDIMDFGRSGSSIRQTNKIVAFLNANIQGKSKLIRAFKANPAGFTARAFTSITVPTVGVFLMQKYMANDVQKQTIDESPAWMTDTFWLVPIPGTDQVARIPKPFDIGTLFSNLPERALKYTYNNDKEAFDGFAKKALADGALPGMITGLTPIIEGMANYSFFRAGRIIPMGEDGRNFEDQSDINTTETAKLLAKGAEKITGGKGALKNFASPRIMDNTIKGLTAGLGTYATSAIDILLDKFDMTNNPVKPEKAPAQKPLAKAFLVNPLQGGKSTEKLYDLKDELTREKGSAKLNNNPFKDQGKLKFITDQTGTMSDITKRIREIENSRTLSAAEKRKQIEPLISKRNEIARDTMKRIEAKESTTK